jgi:hypothetical protein
MTEQQTKRPRNQYELARPGLSDFVTAKSSLLECIDARTVLPSDTVVELGQTRLISVQDAAQL